MIITFTEDIFPENKNPDDKPLYRAGSQYDVSQNTADKWVAAGSAKHGIHNVIDDRVNRKSKRVTREIKAEDLKNTRASTPESKSNKESAAENS